MENTVENKAKFFAQYWGQKVCTYDDRYTALDVSGLLDSGLFKSAKWYLKLKLLSSISDEDAVEVYKITNKGCDWVTDFSYEKAKPFKERFLRSNRLLNAECFDYLRLKGYALDWNGITIKQQIEFGWIKLKE